MNKKFHIKTNGPLLEKILKGIKRTSKSKLELRTAISLSQLIQLCQICTLYTTDDINYITYHTALVLSFWLMLRPGEYTYNSKQPLYKILRNKHIQFASVNDKKTITITIPSPKTNNGELRYQSISTTCKCHIDKIICPYHITLTYLAKKSFIYPYQYTRPDNFLFITKNKKFRTTSLNYAHWCNLFTQFANSLNISTNTFKPHSMRISGTTYLYKIGIEESVIRTAGRWSSDCWRRYLRISNNEAIVIIDNATMNNHSDNIITQINIPPLETFIPKRYSYPAKYLL